MNPEFIPLTERLFSALLTGCYQGLLITGIVWLCLRASRGANAATRYAVWCLTLGGVAALPVLHFVLEAKTTRLELANGGQAERAFSAKAPGQKQAAKAADSSEVLPTQAEPSAEESRTWVRLEMTEGGWYAAVSGAPAVREGEPENDQAVSVASASGEDVSAAAVPDEAEAPRRRGLPVVLGRLLAGFGVVTLPVPRAVAITILCAIGALAVARLVALALQLLALRHLRRTSQEPPAWLEEQFRMIARRAGLNRVANLRVSDETHTPIVVGLHRPTVLFPEEMLATPEPARLNPVLRHEVAHLQRFDDWANFIQQVVKALFGFHPAVLWISRRMSVEREIACDDHVLHAGQKPKEYALFLTEFATQNRGRIWTAAPAGWSRKSQLTERVNMILKTNRSISPRVGRTRIGLVSATLAGCAAIILAAAPRVSLGEQPEAAQSSSASEDSVPPVPPATPGAGLAIAVAPAVDVAAPALPVIVAGEALGAPVVTTPLVVGVNAPAGAPTPVVVGVSAMERRVPQSGPRAKNERIGDLPAPLEPGSPPGSIEERLERLERMVERLLREQPGQPGAGGGYVLPRQPWAIQPAPAPGHPLPPLAPGVPRKMQDPAPKGPAAAINPRGLQEEALRGRIVEDRARALAKQAEKNAELASDLELKLKLMSPDSAPAEMRLRGLEARRRAIEQQMAALEGQLHQLEKQQDQLEREREKLEEQHEMQLRQREQDRQQREKQLEQRDQEKRQREKQLQQREEEKRQREKQLRSRDQEEKEQERPEQEKSLDSEEENNAAQ